MVARKMKRSWQLRKKVRIIESSNSLVLTSSTSSVQTGEEDEDTLFQVRGKLYALSDQNSWKERGTGLLRLNVRKSDGGGARLGKGTFLSELSFKINYI